ncbi:kinase-like domain-containing protein [Armillaria nabsnona]|nr:kinase-like domain-containing protein [Armillaria nabsnona]
MGGDVKSLVRRLPSGKRYVPLPLAKHILRHVLQGLVQIHRLGIAHTDLKHDNIMFDVDPSLDIPSLLTCDPPRLNIPEQTWEGTIQTAVSQPLPSPSFLDDLLTRNFFIADFGSAQIVEPDDRTTDNITPCALRAPETILLGPWNQRVDIWTFGCLVFELITGHNLFEYVPYPDRGLDAAAGHLWQMICFTGEGFEPKQLKWSQRATQYFERTTCGFCYLKENPPRFIYPFETPLRKYKVISEEDVLVTATFMRRCLRLDPDDRPSAEQLLDDPFWAERGV